MITTLRTRSLSGALLILLIGGQRSGAQDNVTLIKEALESKNPERERAALVLIPELGLKGAHTIAARAADPKGPDARKLREQAVQAAAITKCLDDYLKRSVNDENKALALIAYGKLAPPAGPAAVMLRAQLASSTLHVRRAAATALADVCNASAKDYGRPGLITSGNIGSVGLSAGAGPAVVWLRAWVPSLLKDERTFSVFADDAKNLLPLCAIALKDEDDQTKASGAEGVRLFARAIADSLPDPSASSAESRVIDPFEAKLKWILLQPAIETLNENAQAIKSAMTAKRYETRLAGTRAAEAVLQARALALVTRRSSPDDLSTLVNPVPPEDSLKSSAANLLPSLANRLDDESVEIRLAAIEGFEHQGAEALSQLGPIIRASQNSDIIVRWVATRTLGRLLPDAKPAEQERIVEALRPRIVDTDLDVRNTALNAIVKGESASKSAAPTILKLVTKGDPDQSVLAIKTLSTIEADRSLSTPVIIEALRAEPTRVRVAAIAYLGSIGSAARSALPELRKLLLDPEEEVRREAARSLLQIESGR